MRAMARWGQRLLPVALAAVLLFALATTFVPSLRILRRSSIQLMLAAMGLIGVVLGWQEWRRWYGKVVVASGALMLGSFFAPQLGGRIYIMGGGTVVILLYLIAGYRGEKDSAEKRAR